MLNECEFIGRMVKDAEFFEAAVKSQARAHFSVAVEAKWKDKDGHRVSKVEFIECVAWGNLGIVMRKFVHKGYKIYIRGRLESSRWIADDGTRKKSTQIVVRRMLILQHPRPDAVVEGQVDGEAAPIPGEEDDTQLDDAQMEDVPR